MIPARPLYQGGCGSVWEPEPSKERVGDWGKGSKKPLLQEHSTEAKVLPCSAGEEERWRRRG